MSDLISRQDAKDAIDMALDHIDHVPPWVYDKLLNALNEVPSAEKAQLSGEDATKDATSDLISRKELLKQIDIDSDGERGFYGDNWKFIDTIESMPSAEPERKTGKWKRAYLDREAMGERPSIFYCSVCNQCIAYPVNYCPSCGADMRGDSDDI